MQSNTSIITKSKLLIYSNKTWVAFKSLLIIEHNKMKDLLLKIISLYKNPNLIISLIFQNKQLVLLYGAFDDKQLNALNLLNSFNSDIFSQTTDSISIRELSGYSIQSLLFDGVKRITNDSFLYYEQFGKPYYCKPYKFSSLTIIDSNLDELLDIFSKQRLLINFSSIHDTSSFQLSLFFFESTKKEIQNSVDIAKQKLAEIPNIKGQLVSFKKSELNSSPTKCMSGLNGIHIKLKSMIKWLLNFNKLKKQELIRLYPKNAIFTAFGNNSVEFQAQTLTKSNTKTMNQLIGEDPLKSILKKLELNNWIIIETKLTTKFSIIKLSNQRLILIFVLCDKLVKINQYDFTSFFSKGLNLILFLLGDELMYSHSQIID